MNRTNPASIFVAIVTAVLFSLASPFAALAQAATYSVERYAIDASTIDERELADSLETLFTEILLIDDDGRFVSYDEKRASELLGPVEARRLGQEVSDSRFIAKIGVSVEQTTATGDAFLDCMVRNSVIGLVGGIISGEFAELIRDKKFDLLAEKLLPRLVRAGFVGGLGGILVSLGAGSVQCAFFE